MNWYKKIASVRDVKKEYLQRVIEELKKAEDVSSVDKLQAEERLDKVFNELDNTTGDILKMPTSIKETMKKELGHAKKVLRDSPKNFVEILDGVILYLDDYMQSLYMDL